MFEHERLDITQQLPQFLEPLLRILVHFHKLTLTEHKFLDRSERATFVKGVINVWSLGEVELGIRVRPLKVCAAMGFDFEKVRLRHLG